MPMKFCGFAIHHGDSKTRLISAVVVAWTLPPRSRRFPLPLRLHYLLTILPPT
jgi:hypothetical protein